MVQIKRFAVWVPAGRAAKLNKFFDFRVVNRQIYRRRPTPQAALANRKCEAIHHADEWHHARGLAINADLFANRPQIAPIAADPTAARRKPYVFIPEIDDSIQAIACFIQEAGNRQATP